MQQRRTLAFVLLAAGAALGQTADAPLSFEVASVKPSAPMGNGGFMMGSSGGPGTRDPGRYSTTNLTLRLLLAQAYGVKDFQIAGPGWMDTERFDIVAKVPPGATKEQFRVMLQNLIIERFKMEVHHDTKEVSNYSLVLGKNGSKLKTSELDASAYAPPTNDGAGRSGPPPPPKPGEFPKLAAGRPGMMIMFSGGHLRLSAQGQAVKDIVDFLSMQLGRPVVDKTGLTGKYDFQLEFSPDGGRGPRGMPVGPPPPPPPGAVGGGDGGGPASASDPGAPNLFTAIQDLGLRLEPGKGPVAIVVIDKTEKVPIEN